MLARVLVYLVLILCSLIIKLFICFNNYIVNLTGKVKSQQVFVAYTSLHKIELKNNWYLKLYLI